MLGIKLRSWMEAVRPKKKQQRKEKQLKSNSSNRNGATFTNSESLQSTHSSDNNWDDVTQKSILGTEDKVPRYSGTNLSSPESAYSTGYSTDGTSPGAPPEYYINIKPGTRGTPSVPLEKFGSSKNNCLAVKIEETRVENSFTKHPCSSGEVYEPLGAAPFLNSEYTTACDFSKYKSNGIHSNLPLSNGIASKYKETISNSGIVSPRQRNRIRTNPWVPANNISPGTSSVGLSYRQDCSTKSPILKAVSPRYCIPKAAHASVDRVSKSRQSLSSSSCSSLSTTTSVNWDLSLARNNSKQNIESDDEDCTLNEMMGKYDESYVYEKETDILSDSDATDCETDIDTGQGSGDPDSIQHELDYIDNGSYLEFNMDMKNFKNTGHCTYHNYEVQKKNSRKRTTRRSAKQEMHHSSATKHPNERRKRSNSSKKKVKNNVLDNTFYPPLLNSMQNTGSRSAGATPLSARRTNQALSKLVTDDNLRRRCNSVTINSNSVHIINQKDKEADKKYRELINEADRLLTSMKSNVLSPRRMPVPPNKRVELLRNAESSKADAFIKTRLIEDTANLHLSKIPSNNFNSSRFSPVKTHITNFISNNSPVLLKKDLTMLGSPLANRKEFKHIPSKPSTPNKIGTTENISSPKTEVMLRKHIKYRKKSNRASMQRQCNVADSSGSSDSEDDRKTKHSNYCCPHSEPVKRKIYNDLCKVAGCNVNSDNCNSEALNKSSSLISKINSTENLRQQVLVNTLANLKRNLECQSASLRRVYRSSNSIRIVDYC